MRHPSVALAGVKSIEHGTYLTDETLKVMAQKGTFFDPTADVVNDLARQQWPGRARPTEFREVDTAQS